MKKTLIFDATSLSSENKRTGIYFVGYNLLKQFIINKNLDVSLYCSPDNLVNLRKMVDSEMDHNLKIYSSTRYPILCNRLKLLKDKYRRQHRPIERLCADILYKCIKRNNIHLPTFDYAFSSCHTFDELIKARKKYIYLHDTIPLIFPEYFQAAHRAGWFLKLCKSLNNNDKYFANSLATKNDFVKYTCLKPEQITIAYLGANSNFYHNMDDNALLTIKKKYGIPEHTKYVFSLCTLEPRKNLIRAVKTFVEFIQKNNINDLVFVLGGGHWEHFIGKLKQEIHNLGEYQNKILCIGYVKDEDLPILYSNAEWFVYTSQYEGFGMPVLEAMQCGCPIITSNNSSLPEVIGTAGQMVVWNSDEQHIAAYEKYYFDKEFRNKKAKEGLLRSKQFSWQKCSEIIVNTMLADAE